MPLRQVRRTLQVVLTLPYTDDETTKAAGEFTLAMAQAVLSNAMRSSGKTQMDVERALGRSHGYLSRILSGGRKLSMRTFGEILAVCGSEVRFSVVKLNNTEAQEKANKSQLLGDGDERA
jgi:hypothetical protein